MRLICGHCGHVNPSGASFCEQCDEYLDWTAVEAPDAPAPAASAPRPPAQAARPDTPTQDVAPVTATAVITEPTRACPRCATGNPLERRFCRRCGEWLVPAAAVPAAPPRPWRNWWQRLVGPLNRADRAAYRRSLSPATRAFRVAVAVLVAVVLVAVLSGFAGDPVGRVRDLVGHQLGSGRAEPGTVRADVLPGLDATARKAARGYHPERLVDGVRSSTWSVPWPGTTVTDAQLAGITCGKGASTGFLLRFPQPVDVREIGFESGGVGDLGGADKNASWLPQTVDLTWTVRDGDEPARAECRRVELNPSGALQRVDAPRASVSDVRVAVVRAFPPPQRQGADELRIGEITVWHR